MLGLISAILRQISLDAYVLKNVAAEALAHQHQLGWPFKAVGICKAVTARV
jgi:hypothetical protein